MISLSFVDHFALQIAVIIGVLMLIAFAVWNARRRTIADVLHLAVHAQRSIAETRLSVHEVAERVLSHAFDFFAADGSAVAILENNVLRIRAASGSASQLPLQIPRSLLPDLIEPAVIREPRLVPGSLAVIPLRYSSQTVGALLLHCADGSFGDALEPLQLIAVSAAAALHHSLQLERNAATASERDAEIDALQRQFRAFMENMPAATFIKDETGHYIYANPFAATFFERELDDVLGATDEEIVPLRDSDDALAWHALDFPIVDASGRRFTGGIAFDITSLERAKSEIAALNRTLETRVAERTEELEAFSYSVSHDLRAPLRAVDGYARLLEEEAGALLNDDARRFLEVIQSETKRMACLIDDLLAFSRLGRTGIAPAPCNMTAMVHSVMSDVRRQYPGCDIHLDCDALPFALADATTMRQVFHNLLSNAVKYGKPGEPVRIEVRAKRHGDRIEYVVSDHGRGFDMRYADKLFGVFQRLHGAEVEGTGIGLAIVERIVRRNGGEVWAEGAVDRGASFHFTLAALAHETLPAEERIA